MAKPKRLYRCSLCDTNTAQWVGQCPDCGAWNSLLEETQVGSSSGNKDGQWYTGFSGEKDAVVSELKQVVPCENTLLKTGMPELDRVLGGGFVEGSVVLIGGDPGIGKSTLLLQAMAMMAQVNDLNPLYVSGEESLQQIRLRAERLRLADSSLNLFIETHVEQIIATALKKRPRIIVIDSIQTVFTEQLQSAPGTVAQVRESAAHLVRFAKSTGTTLVLVGHVTKQGVLAGPRVLEHMVDTVLYFEGDATARFRILRAVKNRFGKVNELGVFIMTAHCLKEVNNPSAIFLARGKLAVAGSTVTVIREGSRPMLVEVQALVDDSPLGNPRRVSVGLDQNRIAMLLAILHRHGGVTCSMHDVFINVVGGVKLSETGADLAILMAVCSSLADQAIPQHWVFFGEVGLTGEIRPVQGGEERVYDAAKHGFTHIVIPEANKPRQDLSEIEVFPVEHIGAAIDLFKNAV